jgi:hypothetical protein
MGVVRPPQGQNRKNKIWRVWPLGVAEPPPGWLSHPLVFLFFQFFLINF